MTILAAAAIRGRSANPPLRKLAIILAVLFAVGAPLSQSLFSFGLSASEFASDGNQTLRAAGYAFSIWSLIYAALVAYAIYQAWHITPNSPLLQAVAWPSAFAIAGCGAWILASAFDLKVLTVAIIVASAVTLTVVIAKNASQAENAREHLFIVWPLAMLAGWLTIASAINALTVLTAYGVITESTASVAGAVGIAVVTLTALVVLQRARLLPYALPIAWGLAAVYVAEQNHRPRIALAAAAAAVVVVAVTLFVGLRGRPNANP